MAAGVRTFDSSALRRWRKAVPRYDRARPGLSHDELAARVGATRAAIIFYEQGRNLPSPARLVALARAIGVEPPALTSTPPEQATLYDLRVWAGLTQAEVATRARLRRNAYIDLEAGAATRVADAVRERLAVVLDVKPEELEAAIMRTRHQVQRPQRPM